MFYSRLIKATTQEVFKDKLEQVFGVSIDGFVLIDNSGYVTFGVDGFDNKESVERTLKNLGVQYILDDTDPTDPNYFIFRINDSRFS